MIRRTLVVSTLLGAGSTMAAALYWLFLNTPESNVLMLASSLLLALAVGTVLAITVNAAVFHAWGVSPRAALAAGTRGTGWFLVAVLPWLLAWWAIGRADDWILGHQGEINAWFIARFGWADISRLLQAEIWISRWLRFAVLPALTLSLLAALLGRHGHGWRGRPSAARTVLVASLVFVLLLALPWQLTAWRPQLPSTWIEPAAAALRLGVVFLLGIIGAAVMIVASVGTAPVERPHLPDRPAHD